ncbi:hypothetical protein CHS0354_030384 [Potamilus streckersoni]|uniref:Uncharacterized protein n=1 Tax=Potamilus streckersoni TaxID=2493646 RepID=A0AAE0T9X8_9BIVA|nr:hypothetical protein CHS0354_030384 [Potamilus streckersoni]
MKWEDVSSSASIIKNASGTMGHTIHQPTLYARENSRTHELDSTGQMGIDFIYLSGVDSHHNTISAGRWSRFTVRLCTVWTGLMTQFPLQSGILKPVGWTRVR